MCMTAAIMAAAATAPCPEEARRRRMTAGSSRKSPNLSLSKSMPLQGLLPLTHQQNGVAHAVFPPSQRCTPALGLPTLDGGSFLIIRSYCHMLRHVTTCPGVAGSCSDPCLMTISICSHVVKHQSRASWPVEWARSDIRIRTVPRVDVSKSRRPA